VISVSWVSGLTQVTPAFSLAPGASISVGAAGFAAVDFGEPVALGAPALLDLGERHDLGDAVLAVDEAKDFDLRP
jgi:hypothetical protein